LILRTTAVALGFLLRPLAGMKSVHRRLRQIPRLTVALAGMATFWLCRLLAQFVAYDCAIWRGDRFRTSCT
jgi:hypothetical protein